MLLIKLGVKINYKAVNCVTLSSTDPVCECEQTPSGVCRTAGDHLECTLSEQLHYDPFSQKHASYRLYLFYCLIKNEHENVWLSTLKQ